MRWGIHDEWWVDDPFGRRWRFWLAREHETGLPIPRRAHSDDPLWHIIRCAFNHGQAIEDHPARELLQIYDALTGARLGDELPQPTRDPRRLLRGFRDELEAMLHDAVESGVLRFERDELPWPFPEKNDEPDDPRPDNPRDEDQPRMRLRIWVLDGDRQPMPGAPYRLRIGGVVRVGTARDNALIDERDLELADECNLEWGEIPQDDPRRGLQDYHYERRLFTNTYGEDAGHIDRKLHNLAYREETRKANVAAFERDYGVKANELTPIHHEGRRRPA
ncbi:hypothetical protein [Pendulispora albinea]|uniref:Uncharacterized protein n=1 Tax=Pendulispora albinea TaxID=2741071 RepID=A0ABZ2MB57_9BACT